MQRIMRSVLVAVMVLMMSFNPAVAWHHWGGGWGRGCGARYHGGYGSHGCSSCNSGCGTYGYSRVVYSSEPYCGGCGSGCGSCESCDGGNCGTSGCDSCGGSCSGCGSCDGGVVTSGEVTSGEIVTEGTPVYHESAPTPPSETIMTAPPTTVTKPMQATPPPTLRPTDPMPESTEAPTPPAPTENTETVDPLFGGPETTPPAETAPIETAPIETAPIETTTPEQPAEDAFGAPSTETPATETPATETPATETPAEGTDSLFGEPADAGTPPAESTPAEGTTPAEEPGADFFGTPEEMPAEGAMPEGESSSTEKPQKKARTFFASQKVLREPGGLASAEMRKWVDNTGNFSCNGRIVRFMDGYVRLLKDNGRTTTVPLYRLSADDLAFVNRQTSARPQRAIAQAANAGAVESATAN